MCSWKFPFCIILGICVCRGGGTFLSCSRIQTMTHHLFILTTPLLTFHRHHPTSRWEICWWSAHSQSCSQVSVMHDPLNWGNSILACLWPYQRMICVNGKWDKTVRCFHNEQKNNQMYNTYYSLRLGSYFLRIKLIITKGLDWAHRLVGQPLLKLNLIITVVAL